MIARSDCALLFLVSMRKYIFAQESFYLQCILKDINEQDTSFLDCKHKHMMKIGFTSRIASQGYHSLVPALILILLETVWVPLNAYVNNLFYLDNKASSTMTEP